MPLTITTVKTARMPLRGTNLTFGEMAELVASGSIHYRETVAQGLASAVTLSLLTVGERSGRLAEMLERSARFHDDELERWLASEPSRDRDTAARVAHGLAFGQPLQHRQREAGGLAGAGLGAGQQVAAVQHGGDGLRLDRGGRVVALVMDGAQQRLGQAEFSEFHSGGEPAVGLRDRPAAALGRGPQSGRQMGNEGSESTAPA
mgnify:CR=1 FL=1